MTLGRTTLGIHAMPTLPVSILDGGKRLPRAQVRMRRQPDPVPHIVGDAAVSLRRPTIEPKAKRPARR
jgi:hypothetical protein